MKKYLTSENTILLTVVIAGCVALLFNQNTSGMYWLAFALWWWIVSRQAKELDEWKSVARTAFNGASSLVNEYEEKLDKLREELKEKNEEIARLQDMANQIANLNNREYETT